MGCCFDVTTIVGPYCHRHSVEEIGLVALLYPVMQPDFPFFAWCWYGNHPFKRQLPQVDETEETGKLDESTRFDVSKQHFIRFSRHVRSVYQHDLLPADVEKRVVDVLECKTFVPMFVEDQIRYARLFQLVRRCSFLDIEQFWNRSQLTA